MTSNEPITSKRFVRVNFKHWQEKMEILLTMLGLYFIFETNHPYDDLHEPACTAKFQTYLRNHKKKKDTLNRRRANLDSELN